jgi:hypothetical protein
MQAGLRARSHNIAGRVDLAQTLRQRAVRETVGIRQREEHTRERRRLEDLAYDQALAAKRVPPKPVARPPNRVAAPSVGAVPLPIAGPIVQTTLRTAKPPEPPEPVEPRAPTRRRLALSIGINYTGQEGALRGCHNDVVNLRTVLQRQFGFTVTIMTDDTPTKPTRAGVLAALGAIVTQSRQPDVEAVFISYSGHGSHARDESGDEPDRRDETIIPLDYAIAGHITDDEIHAILAGLGCPAVMLFDSCHSGSILDLHYRYQAKNAVVEENRGDRLPQRVVCLSGCTDSTTSADAYIEASRRFQGAMTTAFLYVLARRKYQATCFEILAGVQARVRAMGHVQVPQLSSSVALADDPSFCGAGGILDWAVGRE